MNRRGDRETLTALIKEDKRKDTERYAEDNSYYRLPRGN